MQLFVELRQFFESLVNFLNDCPPFVDLQNFLLHELALILARQADDGFKTLLNHFINLEALPLVLSSLLLLPLEPVSSFLGVVDPLVGLKLLLQRLDGGINGLTLLLVDLPIFLGAWQVEKEGERSADNDYKLQFFP